jgi:hypothetical protein
LEKAANHKALYGTRTIVAPEDAVGSVFPDDFISVDGEWRRVREVITTLPVPVIIIEPRS